jgi:hypothetical protein
MKRKEPIQSEWNEIVVSTYKLEQLILSENLRMSYIDSATKELTQNNLMLEYRKYNTYMWEEYEARKAKNKRKENILGFVGLILIMSPWFINMLWCIDLPFDEFNWVILFLCSFPVDVFLMAKSQSINDKFIKTEKPPCDSLILYPCLTRDKMSRFELVSICNRLKEE